MTLAAILILAGLAFVAGLAFLGRRKPRTLREQIAADNHRALARARLQGPATAPEGHSFEAVAR